MEGFKTFKDKSITYVVSPLEGCESSIIPAGTIFIPEKLLVIKPNKRPAYASISAFEWAGILPLHSSNYDKPKCPDYMTRIFITEADIERMVKDYEQKIAEIRSKNTLRELLK